MRNGVGFVPEENNLGGRNIINFLVYNHHKTLLLAKPIVNLRRNKQSGTNNKKKEEKRTKEPDLSEVYQAFKKIHNLKAPYLDNKAPKTLPLSEKLNKNMKRNKLVEEEHQRNLLAQDQRKKRRSLDIERYQHSSYFEHKSMFY